MPGKPDNTARRPASVPLEPGAGKRAPISPSLFDHEELEIDPHIDATMKVLFAFAITFVVAGHVIAPGSPGGISFGYNLFPPASFHVGIFVFVAGYFYKSKHEQEPGAYLKRRVLRLLVPLYAVYAVYGLVVVPLMHLCGFTIGQDPSLYNLLLDPLFGGHAFMWNLPLWFVAPLFFTELLDFGLRKLLRVGESRIKELVLIVCYFAAGALTVALCGETGFQEYDSSPLILLARIGVFLPCYALGRLYQVFLESHDSAPNWLYFAVVISVQIILIVVTGGKVGYVISWCWFYSGPLVTLLELVCGIAFWLRISRIVAPGLSQSASLRAVANSTFSIMAHQFLGIFLVKAVFAGLAALGLIGGFDMGAFLSDFWYYWYPPSIASGHAASCAAFATIYVAAGVAVPLGIHWCWLRIRERASALRRARNA
ncbi:MAG: hypothetical protein ACOX69_02470 [Coriobacteriales bacterium]|jgi:fucose 4-O-acetylase-like acetyltransferase